MSDAKKIEAVLFAIGDKIEESEISKLTKISPELVKTELDTLKARYSSEDSTFILLNEGTKWKLTVREDFMPIVQRIVPKTELSRPVMETLAVIAWKSPVLQSSIIDIRSTKAYDHIGELVESGFITKQKYGRSFMLRPSQQFFEYFDVNGKEGIKEMFKNVKGIEKAMGPLAEQKDMSLDAFSSPDKAEEQIMDAIAAIQSEDKQEMLPAAEEKPLLESKPMEEPKPGKSTKEKKPKETPKQ